MEPSNESTPSPKFSSKNYNSSNVNHVVAIEDGEGRYIMGNVEMDIERLRMTENTRPDGDENICVVCGGKANGIHFKVKSCPADNAFFRRSVVEARKYICRANGNCDISKNAKCICRACRLKKCLLVGMDPKAVQPHRDSIGKKLMSEMKPTRQKSPLKVENLIATAYQPNTSIQPEEIKCMTIKSADSSPPNADSLVGNNSAKSQQSPTLFELSNLEEQPTNNHPSTSSYSMHGRMSSACSVTDTMSSEADGLIEQGLRAYARLMERRRLVYGDRSIEKLMDGSEPEYKRWKGVNHYRMTESMAVATANLIEFIKSFPGFCALSIRDQMVLFKHFGASFIIFEKYYITYKLGGLQTKRIYRQDYTYVQLDVEETSSEALEAEKIIRDSRSNNEGYFIPPEARTQDGQLVDDDMLVRLTTPYINYALEMLVKPMEELKFTDVEFIGSTLAILFDPNLPNLSPEGREHVKELRNQLYKDWFAYYESLGDEDAALKLGNTILIKPILDKFVKHYQEHFHMLRVFGFVEYDKVMDDFFIGT